MLLNLLLNWFFDLYPIQSHATLEYHSGLTMASALSAFEQHLEGKRPELEALCTRFSPFIAAGGVCC